jgi:hypothetical protein
MQQNLENAGDGPEQMNRANYETLSVSLTTSPPSEAGYLSIPSGNGLSILKYDYCLGEPDSCRSSVVWPPDKVVVFNDFSVVLV